MQSRKTSTNKGFTLIELIVTVSILAVLVTILVVAINPAEQLARARDSRRAADLDALKSAINLYIAQATTTPNLDGAVSANNRCKGDTVTSDQPTMFANNTAGNATSVSATWIYVTTSTLQDIISSAAASSTNNAISWLPVALGLTPGGSPLEKVPLDPTSGDSSYYYSFVCDITSGVRNFELNENAFESTYFKTDLDLDGTDGGNSATKYEVGNDPGLDLMP